MEILKNLFEKAINHKSKLNDVHRVCKDINNTMVLFYKKDADILRIKIIDGVDI